jgi:cytochrome c-type biogenesis protein CcmF
LFLGAAIAILIGVTWPLISELVTGATLTVGPPYYNLVVGAIFAGILILMGIIPLIGWGGATLSKIGRKVIAPLAATALIAAIAFALGARDAIPFFGIALVAFVFTTTATDIYLAARARQKNTREGLFTAFLQLLQRNRRRYGGYLIHLAVMIMAVGIIGSRAYTTDETQALAKGQAWDTRGYTLTFDNIASGEQSGEGILTVATVGLYQNGQRIATLQPANVYYPRQQQPETVPAIYSDAPFFRRDFYVIIQGWDDNFANVSFRAYINPMVSWLWFGGILFLLSTIVTLLPDPTEARARVRAVREAYAYASPSE